MNNDFVLKLQEQAKQQSFLYQKRLLPKEADWITSLVDNYPWQTMFFLAVGGALVWELL